MKLLSVAVPCYNSQDYMRKCVDCLLQGGDRVEIIIVDDGSKDNTAAIADEYAQKYPDIVRAVHQENAGHGGAVNTGLAHAQGIYFKVVDSDDWVDVNAFHKILDTLEELIKNGSSIDMMISNFVYDKVGARHKKTMHYRNAFPVGRVFNWGEMGHLWRGQYILMHSVIYRTNLLRDCHLELPLHTFYVDNIFVYVPLPYVKNIYYMDINFYHYFIGRSDQSVNEANMIKRVDQQIRITKFMIDSYQVKTIADRGLRSYMSSYMEIMMAISSIFLIKAHSPEALDKKRELWCYLKSKDVWLYRRIRLGMMGVSMNLPGKGGRKMTEIGYAITRRFYGFN